jgi:hypothetical protein
LSCFRVHFVRHPVHRVYLVSRDSEDAKPALEEVAERPLNLFLIAAGIRQWAAPYGYKTNVPITEYAKGIGYQSGRVNSQDELREPLTRLRPSVAWVMEQSLGLGDLKGALRAALFLHHYCPDRPYSPSYASTFCQRLDRELQITVPRYVYATLDAVASRLDA